MEGVNRRTAIAFGLTAAAATAVPLRAKAATYGPKQGEPLFEGVRRIPLSERESMIPNYREVRLFDVVFQPGAEYPKTEMPTDMVCHMYEGQLQVTSNGNEFTAEPGQVWTCNKGGTESAKNASGELAIMRVAVLAS